MTVRAIHNFSYLGKSYKAGDELVINELEYKTKLHSDVEIIEKESNNKKTKQVKKVVKK
jgi:hypothetical protein